MLPKLLVGLVSALLFATPALSAPETRHLARADGSQIEYTLDAPAGQSKGLVVLVQGSGCGVAARNNNLALARIAFADYTALTVEKVGVTADASITNGFTDCPAAFHAAYTLSLRVEDLIAVITATRPRAPGDLVLFGGSEGGLAVAMLAARMHPDSAIILSSAMGMEFGAMVRSTVPPEGQATIDAGFAAARANPESAKLFAGSSYRFWADILDHVALDHMLQTNTPFLAIQGGRDTSAPVAAARLTADRFLAEGRCNLTYWEFPGLDHAMLDPQGNSRMAGILGLASEWARSPQTACL